MNYYLLEPCNWGESAEDCRVVVAGSEREARALLNITRRDERDWFNTSVIVMRLEGVCSPDLVPHEVDLVMMPPIGDDLSEYDFYGKDDSNETIVQKLKVRLETMERVFKKERQQAALRMEDSACCELGESISKHLVDKGMEAIRQMQEEYKRLTDNRPQGL